MMTNLALLSVVLFSFSHEVAADALVAAVGTHAAFLLGEKSYRWWQEKQRKSSLPENKKHFKKKDNDA